MPSTVDLNLGGTDADNPILTGQALTIRLNKQDATETLRKAWVIANGQVFATITDLASVSDFQIDFNVVSGTHLKSGSSPVRNEIHITTSSHRHTKIVVWVSDLPAVKVLLNGYDGNDPNKPYIFSVHSP